MRIPANAARNETRKITATFVNNVAVSFIVTAVVVPTVSLTYPAFVPQTRYWWAFGALWLCAAFTLHVISRRVLGRVEE